MTTLDMNLLTPSPKQQLLPMISRLDRLDRLLVYLEERRHLSETRSVDSLPTKIEQSRPLSSALEEINFKGTLIERIGNLENRVLQLSIEMEEGSTSSSSTIPTSGINVHEKGHRDPAPALDRNQNKVTIEEKASDQVWTCTTQQRSRKSTRHKATLPTRHARKWLGWLQMGC